MNIRLSLKQYISNLVGRRNTSRLLRLHASATNLLKYGDANHFQQVFIEINGNCNRACAYCPNSVSPQSGGLMTLATFRQILSRLAEINWTGIVSYHYLNEPTLHPQLAEFVALTKSVLPKAMPTLFTNGDNLTPELCSALAASGLERSTITKHAPSPKDWDVKTDFAIAGHTNIFHKETLKAGGLYNPSGILKNFKTDRKDTCRSPRHVFAIRIDGRVSVCCYDFTNETNLGNVLTTPIHEIWKSAEFVNVRKRLQAGERVYKICQGCSRVE